jgi:hypothetical protein
MRGDALGVLADVIKSPVKAFKKINENGYLAGALVIVILPGMISTLPHL